MKRKYIKAACGRRSDVSLRVLAMLLTATAPLGLAGAAAAQTPDPRSVSPEPRQPPIPQAPATAALPPADPTASDGRLEEIVVTAQRRAENLQRVPIAVTAVTAERLEAAGIVNTASLATVVSGLSIGNAAGNFRPFLRGVGTTAYGIGIESPVALVVDGVYYAAQATGFTDLSDVAQVTVLKGPQGTLFGRNATGGVIQLTTRDPEQQFRGQLRTELDNYLTSRTNAYVTGGLTDTVSANFSVSYADQGEGWGTNINTGREQHKINHDVSARAKLFWIPTDQTSIKLRADFNDRSDSLSGNIRPAPGTLPRAPGSRTTSDVFDSDLSVDPSNKVRSYGGSLDVSHDLGFAKLVSITGYREYQFETLFDASLTPNPQLIQFIDFRGNQFTQELQLVSKQSDAFNWVVGAYYFKAKDREPLVQSMGSDVSAAPFMSNIIAQTARGSTESIAGYAQGTLKLFDETRLTLGLRYTDERRTLDGRLFGTFFGLNGVPGADLDLTTIFLPVDDALSFGRLTWRAALDHNLTPDILGYVSYNRGFKSGGFNGFNPSPANPPYDPEIVDTVEAGLKTELFDRRVRLNTALFFSKYSDIQLLQFIAVPFLFNAADAEVYGLDVDLEARATEELRFTGGLELLNAKFTGQSIGTTTIFVPNGDGATISEQGSIRGNRLAFAPKISLNIGATYTKKLDFGVIEANITNSYSSRFFLGEDNFVPQKAYDTLNLALNFTTNDERLTVGVFGRNLFDEEVATFLTNGALGYAADYANPPRTYGATLTLRFGR